LDFCSSAGCDPDRNQFAIGVKYVGDGNRRRATQDDVGVRQERTRPQDVLDGTARLDINLTQRLLRHNCQRDLHGRPIRI